MTSLIKTIFIKENDKNVLESLKTQGINTKVFENRLAGLFNRVYNNFVGYYIFKQDETVYKLIILPKTIREDENAEKNFVNYLLHYYRINSIYKIDKEYKIPDSLLSLAFENNNDENNSHLPLDEFEFYKYKSILVSIEQFFKRHKNYKKINVDYTAQAVKYKLNLKKNIQELDKTNIHQTQSKDIVYSLIATVTFNALKLFLTHRMKKLTFRDKKALHTLTTQLKSFILKKYAIDKSYKLSLAKLNSFKTTKTFKATIETKQLLVNIKSLFGFEQMYNDDVLSIDNRFDLVTSSLFIDPIYFYEWYVYDILKSYANTEDIKILFDKNSGETTTEYQLTSSCEIKNKKSKPDYVLVDEKENIQIVIDAKWKNIDNLVKVDSSDYLKLKLDSSLLQKDRYMTISYLVYPNLQIGNELLSVNIDNNSYFDFGVLQIDMNFEKNKNCLDFSYDYQAVKNKIDQDKYTEELKSSSEEFSNGIDKYRTEIITRLLNQEVLEDKEEILLELDNKLIESTKQLNEKVEEQISPEIKEILEKYNDVLADDSKKFLKSSSSIYNYYKNKKYQHFDYAMPGSGLWKLVELELNTSFAWFLRIKSHVCNNTCSWTNISNAKRSITQDLANGKKVKLNQYEHGNKNRLQGLMLGGMNLLLQDNDTMEEFREVANLDSEFFNNELTVFVSIIINLRNEHAHIKAMSMSKYEELDALLFDKKQNEKSNIQKLLEFKLALKEEI